ncbi:MAG: DMT family transporter [Synergistaceae bacterium]|nr:DMT family transporter [Synergistaceae bacterium]
MNIRDNFHIYAVVTIICWSMAYVLTRLALKHFSVYSLGILRYIIASLILVAVVAATKMKIPDRSDFKWFAWTGATGFFLYMIVFNKGCEIVNSSTSSVIVSTTPIITALLAHFIYDERLKIYQWAAIAVAFSGAVVLTMSNGEFIVNSGLVWLFSAALCLSAYNLLQRKLTKNYSALQTSAFSIFTGTIMLSMFTPGAVEEVVSAPAEQLFYVAVLGIFPSAVAYVSWSMAFAKAENTSSVSNYMFVTPFLATLLGFLIAGETPDTSTILGGLIILTGLLLFSFGGKLRIAELERK